ncbi:hypothetical protein GCM10010273_16080 [Streptomyces lavendulocolor]
MQRTEVLVDVPQFDECVGAPGFVVPGAGVPGFVAVGHGTLLGRRSPLVTVLTFMLRPPVPGCTPGRGGTGDGCGGP